MASRDLRQPLRRQTQVIQPLQQALPTQSVDLERDRRAVRRHHDLALQVHGERRIRLGADYRKIDDYFVNVQNNLVIDGYGRLDAFVALRSSDERWELSLQGRNLTDDASYVSGALIDALTMLRPRTYAVNLTYRQP